MNVLHQHRPVRGVTLVELLVVVTILMMLAAFAIPVVRPLTEGRRIREAARAIDVFITQAKTEAIVNQRPVGIVLERMRQGDEGDPDDATDGNLFYQDDACNILRMVEIPPPYGGDLADTRVRLQNWSTLAFGTTGHPYYNTSYPTIDYIVLKIAVQTNSLSDRILKWGDKVRFGFMGALFTLVDDPYDNGASSVGADFDVDTDGYIVFSDAAATDGDGDGFVDYKILTAIAPADELGGVAWPNTNKTAAEPPDTTNRFDPATGRLLWSSDITFEFYRQPQPSPIAPLRLPKDTVIDLADSGYLPAPAGGAEVFGNVATSLSTPAIFAEHLGPMVLFASHGAIEAVYHWQAGSYAPTPVVNPVYLLIGKWERTGTNLPEDGLRNWQDASNLWMAIGPQSGFVTTAEVSTRYLHDNGTPADTSDDYFADNVSTAGVSVPLTVADSRRYAREAQISKGALSE